MPVKKEEEYIKEEKEKLLKMSEISLVLDHYDDIFSDFDPRPYSQRALSDDFLAETKRASRDKVSGNIELKLLVHKALRNVQHETLIKKRLREHFKKHSIRIEQEKAKIVKEGIAFILIGMFLMAVASYMMFKNYNTLFSSFIIILLEPGGWFFFWEGLRLVIFESKLKTPDLDFYRKMSKCDISFLAY
jgi:hypothetical protein